MKKNLIGRTNLSISELGIGTAPIGGWPTILEEEKALETLESAWKNGIRYFDTAPLYSKGYSELLLSEAFKYKKNIKVITKVGYYSIPKINILVVGDII